ncbi:MAG: hypothetical protein KAT74_01015 [Candidatus Cloacimonetes bacterium]|nr:hypothetical protein [Candidatus Cloacimonadota bacterium]
MNHFKFLLFFVFLMIFALIIHTKEVKEHPMNGNDVEKRHNELVKPASPDTVLNENTSKDLTQLILGKWEIAPNKRASEGFIIFDLNGTYEMYEKFHDGAGVSKKGEYLLYSNVIPVKIDICLDKCNNAGSEWTTLFGIIRVISNEKLEIHTSPDDKYPSGFSDDKSDEYTMILSRSK